LYRYYLRRAAKTKPPWVKKKQRQHAATRPLSYNHHTDTSGALVDLFGVVVVVAVVVG
jgi:hypothetical protein